MKKIKLLNVLGASLLVAITITMPIVLVSCGQTTETEPSALQKYKWSIENSFVRVDQEAIDMLGTELYRNENGYDVLDLSHWAYSYPDFGLNVFNKPVDKIIFPSGDSVNSDSYSISALYPKLKSDDVGKQLWQIYPEFALKGNFEINFNGKSDRFYLAGVELSENYVIQETDLNPPQDIPIDDWFKYKLNAFPLTAFQNVSKITLNTKQNAANNSLFKHASLPYAFSNIDKNDPELVEYNGKKYPGIIAQKEYSAQAVSAIIPYTTNPTNPTDPASRFLNGNIARTWPGFVKSDKTLGEGFYYAPLHDQSLKVFFTTIEDVNQFFAKTYDTYAKANLNDNHIQKNYQTFLKIFPHKDSTPQNPKIDWSGIFKLPNN